MAVTDLAVGAVAGALRKSRAPWMASHVNPEGDAVGALLGLGLALEQLGIRPTMYLRDGVPPNLNFLPGADRIVRTLPTEPFDLLVIVDCDRLTRIGPEGAQAVRGQAPMVRIDHHISGPSEETLAELVDSKAAATAELIPDVIRALGAEVTRDIAICLLAGLVVDTGRYSYSNVTPHTLRLAAELVEAGADPHQVFEEIYENRTIGQTWLLGRALAKAQQGASGSVIYSVLTPQDFVECDCRFRDTEGIIDELRAVSDAEVAILFSDHGDGDVKVSLRSRGAVNVAEVAETFGGGGHAQASGLRSAKPLDEVVKMVLDAVTR